MQFQAQSERFAAQKQCFCFKRLSAPNCLCALRSSTKAGRRAYSTARSSIGNDAYFRRHYLEP
ncbi:hypothetical protein CJI54_01010 [Bifidobacteriaceae bacterium NR026]|nr:hypothetical protein CJI54_01010 [Bifidobacteriaceae bacterium NR026]